MRFICLWCAVFLVIQLIPSSSAENHADIVQQLNEESELRGQRVKRAPCWGWTGGDQCRKKCQRMTSLCTHKKYLTGHCEGWTNTCVCKPKDKCT